MRPVDTVLAIDDDGLIRAALSACLPAYGYRVLVAGDAEEAFRLVAEQAPDCILLDLVMPGKDGFEVARELRSLQSTQDIPIIILSARRETESKIKSFGLTVNDYLTKPFDFDELNARIQLQIKLRRAQQVLVERQKQEALMDLVGGLADTLMNRLHHTLLLVEVLHEQIAKGKSWTPERLFAELNDVQDSILRSVDVVSALIQHTRWMTRQIPGRVELSGVLQSLPDHFPDVEIRFSLDEPLHPVRGTPDVQEVFRAVCQNAWEAMRGQPGRPVLEVGAALTEDGNSVRVAFRDRGCGIKREDLPKVFTPFFTTKGTESPGLGLWMVYRLMENWGGRVDVFSESEKGAEFVLTFPVFRKPTP
ncbi:MAG: response regulator [Candidatus Tectomicrobia bacterium]|nr:response regulator [Candidatus Tectomicrobia bacterium]